MKRINWPFLCIVVLAILAVFARAILTKYYPAPRILRHHLADFGFPAVVTVVLSSLINLVTPIRMRLKYAGRFVWAHLVVVLLGTAQGLNIEYQDYTGADRNNPDDFDPGALIASWLGVQDTDTFDWWDIVAICLGGLLVFYLQWRSTRHIRSWRRGLMFLSPEASSPARR